MPFKHSRATLLTGVCAAALCAGALITLEAQQPAPGGRGGGRGGAANGVFAAADQNQDGVVTRDELKAAFAKWLSGGNSLTQDQLAAAVSAALPQPGPPPAAGRGAAPQNQTPKPEDVEKMMAALPDKAPAKPRQPRKVLVLAKAAGFVHSCIPLAAKTVEALGQKTGAWSTTVTYDPAAITAQNLMQYDLLFLDNTTGAFLDDPNDQTATESRKSSLLEFVRSGKGLAGIHAAGDSYHESRGGNSAPAPGGRGGPGATLAAQMMTAGDKDGDRKLSGAELNALADAWFEKIDSEGAGKVSRQNFTTRLASVLPPAPPPAPAPFPRAATTKWAPGPNSIS